MANDNGAKLTVSELIVIGVAGYAGLKGYQAIRDSPYTVNDVLEAVKRAAPAAQEQPIKTIDVQARVIPATLGGAQKKAVAATPRRSATGRRRPKKSGRRNPARSPRRGSSRRDRRGGRETAAKPIKSLGAGIIPVAQQQPARQLVPAPAVPSCGPLYSTDPALNGFLTYADALGILDAPSARLRAGLKEFNTKIRDWIGLQGDGDRRGKSRDGGRPAKHDVSETVLAAALEKWRAERARTLGVEVGKGRARDDVRQSREFWIGMHAEFKADLGGLSWKEFRQRVYYFKSKTD